MIKTNSPVNQESIEAQTKRLVDHLERGKSIHFIQARQMGIGFLNSRMSEIRKTRAVFEKWTKVGRVNCKLYSFKPF